MSKSQDLELSPDDDSAPPVHGDQFGEHTEYTHQSDPSSESADDEFSGLCNEAVCAEVLGLSGVITMDDVRTAYRQKIASYHPDKVAHLGPKLRAVAELESKRINAAYQYFEDRYGQDA